MGPFESDEEVVRFVEKRTEKSTIKFDRDACIVTGNVSDRIPREMISFANALFAKAMQMGTHQVTVALLNEEFKNKYSRAYEETLRLRTEFPSDAISSLNYSFHLTVRSTASEAIDHKYPNLVGHVRELAVEGTEKQLDRLCMMSVIAQKVLDNKYKVQNGIYKYALTLTAPSYE